MTSMRSHHLLVDVTGNNIASAVIFPQGFREEVVTVFVHIGVGGGTVTGRLQTQGKPFDDDSFTWDNLSGTFGIALDQAGVSAWIRTFQKHPAMRLRIAGKNTDHPINAWIIE